MRSFLKSWQFILLFLIFILANFALALYFRLYYLFWWLDIAHHFLGGLWLASTALILKNKFGLSVSGRFARPATFLAVMGVLALAGVLWEFLEFGGDR